jgi:multicomponent K+:H+ antiporter subunit E
MLKRLFPHPYLTLTLIVLWFLLVNQWKTGSLVMAIFLATVIPHLTSAWWPDRPRVRRPFSLFTYTLLVLWDVIVANFQVARIVLFMPRDKIRSAWVTVPLDLRSPEAITLLAGTITMTPGTLTADMSACGRALLIHSLHAPDPDSVRDDIKARYEARLKRIFE